ncbi:hypothetical protein [uncultured Thalassolituus sp.]|uniref:hypothetical protein n=1 Tax=uncultured Thalassolituus sp. TaxID=285273 RepID=UPI0026103351|nr:hypothetical protein [uncultured Thalassolituus sp.]
MAAVPLSNYLVYSSEAKEGVGRAVYIDPSLIATFTECVDPTCEVGRNVAIQIQQQLSSTAGGVKSGQSVGDAAEFYSDIGSIDQRCVRVFYRILQVESTENSRGPGVYIHDIKRFQNNSAGTGIGLFRMNHEAGSWRGAAEPQGTLSTNILRMGSQATSSGLMELDELADELLEASSQATYKTDFNLYHCPLAIVNNGKEYDTPEKRFKILSPEDLTDILTKTVNINRWDSKSVAQKSYTVYCYADASKLLQGALERLGRAGNVSLSNFTFEVIAPHSPYSQLEKLVKNLKGKANLNASSTTAASGVYQRFDIDSTSEDSIAAFKKYGELKKNKTNISFSELWRGLGGGLALN